MKGFLLEVKDHSVAQTVKVDLLLFPFNEELRKKRKYFEFQYIPVCNTELREEMALDFPESKLIKDVWGNIDFVYFTCIQTAFSQMEQQRKTVPNFKDFIQLEIAALKENRSEKYPFFQTEKYDNFNFAGAFQEVLIYEVTNKISTLNNLMFEDRDEGKYTTVYSNLIETARNNARLRVIDSFKQLLELCETKPEKKLKEKEELKIIFSEEEMRRFLGAFKSYFFQDQWGILFRKIYAISNLDLPADAPESNSYNEDDRVNFIGKQITLVELFKRIRYNKKLLNKGPHSDLGYWLHYNFNYQPKKNEDKFIQVPLDNATRLLSEGAGTNNYKQSYILKDQFKYIPPDERPKE